MAQTYPTGIPSSPDSTPQEVLGLAGAGKGLSAIVDDYGLDIIGLATKVGIDASAVTTTHDYKLSEVTGSDKAVGKTATQTLTTKTINLTSNTLTGTTAQFNTALSDNDFATLAGSETLTNKTLTAPKLADLGFIADANGNELIIGDTVTSAVNEITVANAATGNAPVISATGGDTNINLAITPKGTGVLYLDSLYGWQRGTGTWTYASATTFTVPQADINLMSPGTKIWLTQTTSKYWYVTSVSGTTVTILANSDYTLANATITAPFFSNANTPVGFPDWFTHGATITAGTGTLTTVSSTQKHKIVGKLIIIQQSIVITTNGTGAGTIITTLPINADTGIITHFGNGREVNIGGKTLNVHNQATGTAGIENYDNTYPAGTGYTLHLRYEYQY